MGLESRYIGSVLDGVAVHTGVDLGIPPLTRSIQAGEMSTSLPRQPVAGRNVKVSDFPNYIAYDESVDVTDFSLPFLR
jgi:hypothetical protein